MRSKGISVIDAIKQNAVPKKLADALINSGATCDCGAILEFDATMRRLRCSSELCRCKIYKEAELALKSLGIDEETIAENREIIRHEVELSDAGCEILNSKREEIVALIQTGKEIEFSRILELTGHDIIGASSNSLTEGYRTLDALYSDFKNYGVVEIARRLRLDKELSLAAVIYKELMRVIEPLVKAQSSITIIVRRSTKELRAGGGGDCDGNVIYTAMKEDVDSLNSNFIGSSSSAKKLVDKINDDRKIKGKDILKIV